MRTDKKDTFDIKNNKKINSIIDYIYEQLALAELEEMEDISEVLNKLFKEEEYD